MIDTQVRKENSLLSAYEKSPGLPGKDRPQGGSSPEKLGIAANNDPKFPIKQKIYELYSTINQDEDEDGHPRILQEIGGEKHPDDHQLDEDDVHFFDIAKADAFDERDRHLEATLGRESDDTAHTKTKYVGQSKDDNEDPADYDTFIVNPSDQYYNSNRAKQSPTKLTKTNQIVNSQLENSQSATSKKKKNAKKEGSSNLKDELFGKKESQSVAQRKALTVDDDDDVGEIKGLIELNRDPSHEQPDDFKTEHELLEVHDELEHQAMISTNAQAQIKGGLIDESNQAKSEKISQSTAGQVTQNKLVTNPKANKGNKINETEETTDLATQQMSKIGDEIYIKRSNENSLKIEKKTKPPEEKQFEGNISKNESMEVQTHHHEFHSDNHEEEKFEISHHSQNPNHSQSANKYSSEHQENNLHDKSMNKKTDVSECLLFS